MTQTSPSLRPAGARVFLSGPLRQCAVGVLIIAAMVSWLRLIGRPMLCECNTVAFWDGDPYSPGASKQFADWFSVLHVIFGMGLFVIFDRLRPHWPTRSKLLLALVSSAIWEAAENTPLIIALFDKPAGAPAYDGDSILNALGDTSFVMVGFLVARVLPLPAAIGVALLLELAISIAISDGFVLGTLRLLRIPV